MLTHWLLEKNLSLQDDLYRLRVETQQAFDEAKSLEARWKVLEREQKELHQVRFFASPHIYWEFLTFFTIIRGTRLHFFSFDSGTPQQLTTTSPKRLRLHL
jgi:hypothetical protein